MARRYDSISRTHLPYYKMKRAGAFNCGLVSGWTQTIFPWNLPEGAPEPEIWFHDILRRDGTPFDPREFRVIREPVSGEGEREVSVQMFRITASGGAAYSGEAAAAGL
jgi:hypothetical protein